MVVRIEQILAGRAPQSDVLLFAWGGAIGQDSVKRSPDNLYEFQEGERVILFLREHTVISSEQAVLNNQPFFDIEEHYTILPDGKAKNYYRTLPLEALRTEVRQALATSSAPSQ